MTAAATFITNLPQCLTMCFNSRMESRARTPSTRNSNRNRSIIIQLWCEAVMNQLIQITINVREVKKSPSFEKPKPSPSSRSPSSTYDDDDVIDAILLLFVFLMSSSKCRVVNTKILQHFFFCSTPSSSINNFILFFSIQNQGSVGNNISASCQMMIQQKTKQ